MTLQNDTVSASTFLDSSSEDVADMRDKLEKEKVEVASANNESAKQEEAENLFHSLDQIQKL